MKQTAHMMGTLAGVALVSGLVLVSMNSYAQPRIKAHQKEAIQQAVYTVCPRAKKYEVLTRGAQTIYRTTGANGDLVGYAFEAKGNGYQGEIKIMVGATPNLQKLTGIEILENSETPGLGARITEDFFKKQFSGLTTLPHITYVLNAKPQRSQEIQAITGATISSRSVVEILNKELNTVRGLLKE